MANISVHNTKKEREGCCSEQGRVGFSVSRDTISIHKLLISISELIGDKVGGRGRPRLSDMVHQTRHCHVHVDMSLFDGLLDFFQVFSNNPTFTTKHSRDISLEHVQRVVDGLFFQDNPCPALGMLGKHLAQTVSGVLVLQEDGSRVNQLLCILREHAVNRSRIIHVWETVSVSLEGITDLLELGLNRFGLVKDDEYTLLQELSRLRVSDGLLDGSESDIAVSTSGTKDHAFKASALFSGDDTSNRGETHVQIGASANSFRFQKVSLVGGGLSRRQFTDSQARGISNEEAPCLLEDLLELHLFVILMGKLFTVGVEFTELRLVSFEFHFQGFQKFSGGCLPRAGHNWFGFQECIDISGGLAFELELVDLGSEKTELALEFIATLDVRDVPTLEGCQFRVQIGELDHSQLAEVCQTVMGSILIHDEGDILHRLGTEPFRHLAGCFFYSKLLQYNNSKS
mmetsp:Transcript_27206/g.48312  ORF Transcript_27206/g.48312 Transcript_27206/m.48312 type:complete len:457 (-) Transcript_27206:29-1399(-)